MPYYNLRSPKQRAKEELKDKLEKINAKIDDLIIQGKTDSTHYQSLLKMHKNLYCENQMI